MTSVLAPPTPHAARPTAGDHGGAQPSADPDRGDEEVGHGGVPEQDRPLPDDEALEDERVPHRGEGGRRAPEQADVGCEERGEAGGPDAGEDERAPQDERLRRPGPEDPAEHHGGRVARHGPGCRGAGAERERREPRVGRPGEVVGEHDPAAEGRAEDDSRDDPGGHEQVAHEPGSRDPAPERHGPRGRRHAERA